ncbi:BTB/POZ domain-containing protein KCTD12-like [Sitodiplosis mosellana]|uniref:BTB/POZ domain-containing protein KCTD12-like n=1 Tax=Sitodiplosis mosellana TaxID=263140 RepID=UPI0024440DAA|nr:BTB/POZ domain-containing protein KCTD12-like [Sitodiplosis mosellana]
MTYNMSADIDDVIELNVGGVHYTTTRKTLTSDKNSRLAELFDKDNQSSSSLIRDGKGRIVLDRDGVLFRFILDYLRDDTIQLPDGFREKRRLEREAEYFKLDGLIQSMHTLNDTHNGCITIGYRGSFQFGKDGLADVKFRKLSRILICGRVNLCRDVFGDTLNESRDPDHGGPTSHRYTSRFFLKHQFIEQAFDMLHEQGFRLVGCCGSGTSAPAAELKPGIDAEESRWSHYNEFVFIRE